MRQYSQSDKKLNQIKNRIKYTNFDNSRHVTSCLYPKFKIYNENYMLNLNDENENRI